MTAAHSARTLQRADQSVSLWETCYFRSFGRMLMTDMPGVTQTRTVDVQDSHALFRRGLFLEYVTLGWNVIGVVVVGLAAFAARSVACHRTVAYQEAIEPRTQANIVGLFRISHECHVHSRGQEESESFSLKTAGTHGSSMTILIGGIN